MNLQKLQDPTTPAVEISSLYKQLIAHKGPSSETRESLRVIASNPNTPQEILKELLWGYFQEVIVNPAVALLQLENPAWLGEALSLGRYAKKSDTLPDAMLEHLERVKNPNLSKQEIAPFLMPWSIMELGQIPPIMDAFALAYMQRHDFVLADFEGHDGNRCLFAIGRKIDARRVKDEEGWTPSIADFSWNPFCTMGSPLDLDQVQYLLKKLLPLCTRRKTVWEKEIANLRRCICALLGYAVLTWCPSKALGRAAIDVGARAVMGLDVLGGKIAGATADPVGTRQQLALERQEIQGAGLVISWLYKTFPGLPKPTKVMCGLAEYDELGREDLLEALCQKLGCPTKQDLAKHSLFVGRSWESLRACFGQMGNTVAQDTLLLAARIARFKRVPLQLRYLDLGFRLEGEHWLLEFRERKGKQSRLRMVHVRRTMLLLTGLAQLEENPTFEDFDSLLYELRDQR